MQASFRLSWDLASASRLISISRSAPSRRACMSYDVSQFRTVQENEINSIGIVLLLWSERADLLQARGGLQNLECQPLVFITMKSCCCLVTHRFLRGVKLVRGNRRCKRGGKRLLYPPPPPTCLVCKVFLCPSHNHRSR